MRDIKKFIIKDTNKDKDQDKGENIKQKVF